MRSILANFLLDAFDGVLGAEPAGEAERREAFVSANLMAGTIGVALWPLHWALIGPVDAVSGVAIFFLMVPLFLAIWVKAWDGDLARAETCSALCLAAFVGFIALVTGGLASPALPWLLVAPIEAAVSGRRSAVFTSTLLAGAGFFLSACLSLVGWLPESRLSAELQSVVYPVSLFAALIVSMFSLRAFQRRHAQEAARTKADADMHRALTDHSLDLITRHTTNGTVLYASPAAENMLGLSAHELEGLSPAMIVHIQDLKQVEQAFARAARGETQNIAFRLRRRDGSYVAVEMRAQRAGDAIVAVTRDMSAASAERVELETARDKAEEVSRAKSRFLASVSHELRTPLNAIIGFSDVMRHEVMGPIGTPKYREYAELIRNSGAHLVDLISDLLDMSKIEAGKFTIERRLVELKPLAEECVAMVQLAANEAGVELSCDVAEGLNLMADRRALKQSMINLLSNAIKFTLTEGRVVLRARRAGTDIELSVSDTGVGIPEQDLARIGKPFEQVEGGLQRAHKGTGLGLSLVKALAELHGGSMDIQSALGDGTTVTLRLPIAARDDVPAEEGTLVYPERFRVRA
ncbi:MAG: PAS domain S-box protein [Alphaproteobacteria bacterium]|nr:PAS domain S-box protein [Alphaproteobacteria bacterium]